MAKKESTVVAPPPETAAAVIAFDLAFRRSLPEGAALRGAYEARERDRFAGAQFPIADGTYRVVGSDWLFTFKGGAFVAAAVARPPEFGGTNVIAVPANG